MGKYEGLKKIIKKHTGNFNKTVENIVWRLAEEKAEEIAGYMRECQKKIAEGKSEYEFCVENDTGFIDNELGAVLTNAVIKHENEMLQDPSANILIMEGLNTLTIKAKRFDEGCDVEEYFYDILKKVSYVDDLMLTIKLSPNAIKYMDAITSAGRRMKDESGFDLFLIYMSDDIVVVELERNRVRKEFITEEEEENEDIKVEIPEPIKYTKPSVYDLPVPKPNAPVDKELLNSVNDVFRGQDYLNAIREGLEYLINKHQIATVPNLPDGVVSTNIDLGKVEKTTSTPILAVLVGEVMRTMTDVHETLNRNMIFVVRCFDEHLINISIVDTDSIKAVYKLVWDNEISRKLFDETEKCELFIKVPNHFAEYIVKSMWDAWIVDDVYDATKYEVEDHTPIFGSANTALMVSLIKKQPQTSSEE